MTNYNNMSDAELLSILGSMADKFEQGSSISSPVQPDNSYGTTSGSADEFSEGFQDYQPTPAPAPAPTPAPTPAPVSTPTPAQPVRSNVQSQEFIQQQSQRQSTGFTQQQPISAQEINWEDFEITLEDTPRYSSIEQGGVDIDMTIPDSGVEMDENRNISIKEVRPTQQNNAFRITPEKSIFADFGSFSILEKRRKTLFESEFGTSYSYKKSWEALLKSIIKEFKDARAVNNFGIRGGLILAKNLEVDPVRFTDDRLGITLYDLINFTVLFKELPNIEMLVLDSFATERMVIKYGDKATDIWKVFRESPSLKVLRIQTATGWKDYKREDFGDTAADLEAELVKTREQAELQHKCDLLNPRKSEMPKGLTYRIKENSKDMTKHSFGVAKEAFMEKNPKLFKTVIYGALGVGLVGLCAVTHVTYGIGTLFKKR